MGREIVTSAEILKQELKRIYAEREGVFKEMMDHTEALPKTVGMDAPLVDREGFPRSDVDVAAVRGHRQKIISMSLYPEACCPHTLSPNLKYLEVFKRQSFAVS